MRISAQLAELTSVMEQFARDDAEYWHKAVEAADVAGDLAALKHANRRLTQAIDTLLRYLRLK